MGVFSITENKSKGVVNLNTKQHVKQRFSKNQELRLHAKQQGFIRPTVFNDMVPNWIRTLADELQIPVPFKRENPQDRLQRELQRNHKAIESKCRDYTAKNRFDEHRKRSQRKRNAGRK